MPSLANVSTGGGHSSMGYYNPAFKLKIVAANNDMQQPQSQPRDNPSDDFLDNLAVGQSVTAKIGNRKVTGKITRIFRNAENEGIFAQIITRDGKSYKVDGSRITLGASDPQDEVSIPDKATSTPGVFAESKLLSFSQFLNESK